VKVLKVLKKRLEIEKKIYIYKDKTIIRDKNSKHYYYKTKIWARHKTSE
jgi:hypothetical protein